MRASSDNVQHFVFVFVQTVGSSGSSYWKENNTCQCVPGTSWGTVVSKIVGARVCNSIFKICFESDANHHFDHCSLL